MYKLTLKTSQCLYHYPWGNTEYLMSLGLIGKKLTGLICILAYG